jgi:hypothetical protein
MECEARSFDEQIAERHALDTQTTTSLNIARMSPDNSPRMRALRMLMMADGTVLVILGALFILVPRHVEVAFHFDNLPAGVDYLIGPLGAARWRRSDSATDRRDGSHRDTSFGCRSALRAACSRWRFGGFCIARGIINSQQGSFGMIVAGFIAIAYLVLYPRKERV